MFRRSAFATLFLVCTVCTVSLLLLASRSGSSDKVHPLAKKSSKASSEQIRQGVTKDLWIVDQGGKRLHHRIESNTSLISFNSKEAAGGVLEHLYGVRCWIEEKNRSRKNDGKEIRFFLAEEGTYFYKNQTFKASDVLLSVYKVGEGSPFATSGTPHLTGRAESILFSIENGTPKFNASRFKATIKEGGL